MVTICVAGLSCRALARSLCELGLDVIAYDAFGDRDLRQVAEHRSLDQLDRELRHASIDRNRLFLLAGGMENRLDVVDRIHALHTVIGPNPDQIRLLRNLRWLRDQAARSEIRFPTIRERSDVEGGDRGFTQAALSPGSWLVKPYRSGGGLGMHHWSGQGLSDGTYLQQQIPGAAISTIMLMNAPAFGAPNRRVPHSEGLDNPWLTSHDTERTKLIGLSIALTPSEWMAPTEFYYRGSMAFPPSTSPDASRASVLCQEVSPRIGTSTLKKLVDFGDSIAEELHLCGYLQADWILDEQNDLWLLEFNPRWTASFEVVELCHGFNLAQVQLQSFGIPFCKATSSRLKAPPASDPFQKRLGAGKAIVYSTFPRFISSAQSDAMLNQTRSHLSGDNDFGDRPFWFADIPVAGTVIDANQPIASVLAVGDNDATILARLREGEAELHHILHHG